MPNQITGKKGELLAQSYLKKQGYKILETNRHFSKLCEADIIALDKSTLVFVVVKTRTSDKCGHPLESITKTKYRNIQNGLFLYLKEHPEYKKYRIDVISIILNPEIKINHLKNIFL